DHVRAARFLQAAQGDAFLIVQAEADENEFAHARSESRARDLEPFLSAQKNSRNRENPLGPGLIVRSVRSWALVVPRERAEEIRRRLLDRDLLQKHLRIASEGETVLLPIRRQVEMGFPTAEKDFAEGFTAIRSYRDVVEVPEAARSTLPSSFDVVGDIAVIKIPEATQEHRRAIGTAILRWNPSLKVVLEDRGVKGE